MYTNRWGTGHNLIKLIRINVILLAGSFFFANYNTNTLHLHNIPSSITMLHINSCRFLKFSFFFSFFFVGFSFMAALVFIKGNNISFESCRCFSHAIQRCDELKYGWCGGVSMEIRTNNMTFTRKITFITSRMTGLTPFII